MNPTQTQVTGADDDLTQQLRSIVAEELAKSTTQPGVTTTQSTNAPAPIPLTLNGQTFYFNSPDELSAAVGNMAQQYNAQLSQVQASRPAQNEVSGADEPAFDMNKYVETLTKDPLAAANYVDEYRYGVKNPAEAFKSALKAQEKLGEIEKTLAVYQFKDAHPEFVGTPQSATVIDKVREAHGLNWDAQGLSAAYSIALQRGLIANPTGQQQQNPYGPNPYAQGFAGNQYQPQGYQPQGYPAQFPTQNFAPAPPPRIPNMGGSFEAPGSFEQLAEGMSPEQIENIFSRFQS
jgi:hypothetical protein